MGPGIEAEVEVLLRMDAQKGESRQRPMAS